MRPVLALRVYNYAAISADAMSQARENVNRIYRDIGIEIEWLDLLNASRGTVSSTSLPHHTCASHIVIRLIGVPGGPRTPEPVLGSAVAAENGGMLSVFYGPVVRVALKSRQAPADILGLVIAHELGHLLLPAPAHSKVGIMRAQWDGDDIRRGAVGTLRFTSSQKAVMQSRTPGGCMREAK
jgi:hypothetical protein